MRNKNYPFKSYENRKSFFVLSNKKNKVRNDKISFRAESRLKLDANNRLTPLTEQIRNNQYFTPTHVPNHNGDYNRTNGRYLDQGTDEQIEVELTAKIFRVQRQPIIGAGINGPNQEYGHESKT